MAEQTPPEHPQHPHQPDEEKEPEHPQPSPPPPPQPPHPPQPDDEANGEEEAQPVPQPPAVPPSSEPTPPAAATTSTPTPPAPAPPPPQEQAPGRPTQLTPGTVSGLPAQPGYPTGEEVSAPVAATQQVESTAGTTWMYHEQGSSAAPEFFESLHSYSAPGGPWCVTHKPTQVCQCGQFAITWV